MLYPLILPWDFRPPVVRVVTAPVIEPISLDEAKAQCRVDLDFTDDDALLESYIAAAREFCESRKGYSFVEQELEYALPWFPPSGTAIELPRATPLQSITSLIYKDEDGTDTTWAASNYVADTSSVPGLLVPKPNIAWPEVALWPVNPIKIRYAAGAAVASPASATVTAGVKLAHRQLVAHWYLNREATIVGFQHAEELALMVDDLLGVGKRIFSC